MNDYIRQTEQRLYAYNDLVAKRKRDLLDLADLKNEGVIHRSRDILYRAVQSSVSISPEELWLMRINKLKMQMASDERELSRVKSAIASLRGDYYAKCITAKYLDGEGDECVADELHCDVSTVRRNRKKLLHRIAVRLYGTDFMTVDVTIG